MEKQEKVLKKIKNSLKHGNEGQLGAKKNDECYTDMQDILNELSQWAALGKFTGKDIICPCDWNIVEDESIYSITITYKDPGVEVAGNSVFKAVQSVYVDLWSNDEELKVEHIAIAEDEIEDFLRERLTCNFVRALTQNARAWGIKSITASGYNPATGLGIKFQDVDYSKYDICITNPPFSLYSEFMKAIVGKIDFIVLAPMMNRNNPCIGGYLMLKQAYLGFGVGLALTFANPTKENNYTGEKAVACDWITSFGEAQAERNAKRYKSGIKYDLYKDEYVEIIGMTMKNNTHPIRVNVSTYPEDYLGWMFASIRVLDNLDQETYEWYLTNCKGILNSNPDFSPLAHKAYNEMYFAADGKSGFSGVLFRKKPTT
jgi:hypothetical protein